MSFYSCDELARIGFAHVGKNVRVSRNASLYAPERIRIGDNTRIDDFCVLSAGEGGIEIGRNVHISVFALCMGAEKIVIGDFCALSSRTSVYSSNDDYSGSAMTNPTVPAEYTRVTRKPVWVGRHSIIGSGSVILPGVTIGEGVAVGALSLVNRDCDPFCIYAGSPVRKIGERRRDLLDLEQAYLRSLRQGSPCA